MGGLPNITGCFSMLNSGWFNGVSKRCSVHLLDLLWFEGKSLLCFKINSKHTEHVLPDYIPGNWIWNIPNITVCKCTHDISSHKVMKTGQCQTWKSRASLHKLVGNHFTNHFKHSTHDGLRLVTWYLAGFFSFKQQQ